MLPETIRGNDGSEASTPKYTFEKEVEYCRNDFGLFCFLNSSDGSNSGSWPSVHQTLLARNTAEH